MDHAQFGMRARPFRPGPDPTAYFPAAPHEEVLAALRQAMAADEPFAVLTGEPGVGKTLLAQVLLERVGDEAITAVITNSHFETRTALLQALLYDLGLTYEHKSEQELRLALTDCLMTRMKEDRRTLIIIDEAHHLSADCLEELRLLANLEARQCRGMQVILLGLPELIETLQRPELRALAQRITTRVCLGRLDADESAEYIRSQIRAAGQLADEVFSDEAIELLAKSAQGLPRILNQTARHALQLTCQSGGDQVDAEAVLEALALIGVEPPAEEKPESPGDAIDAFRLGMIDTHRLASTANR